MLPRWRPRSRHRRVPGWNWSRSALPARLRWRLGDKGTRLIPTDDATMRTDLIREFLSVAVQVSSDFSPHKCCFRPNAIVLSAPPVLLGSSLESVWIRSLPDAAPKLRHIP